VDVLILISFVVLGSYIYFLADTGYLGNQHIWIKYYLVFGSKRVIHASNVNLILRGDQSLYLKFFA